MYYISILAIFLFDTLIKASACSTYYAFPNPGTSGSLQGIPYFPNQGDRLHSPNPINIVIKPEYPGQAIVPQLPPEGRSSERSVNPIERRKLISSVLTLPGMLADKLISGEISV